MSNRRFSSRGGSRGFNRKRRFGGRRRFGPKPINITAFIEKAQEAAKVEPVEVKVERSFADFDLRSELLEKVEAQGFSKPTPIQDRVFDLVTGGSDVVGVANTGTGKTGAFLIPLVDRLLQDKSQKVLVIAPTRELALQINSAFMDLAHGLGLYSVQCIGGTPVFRQIRDLERGFSVVVGTPGRIMDLVERRKLNLGEFKVVVLDEVDRMLDMGFVADIRKILANTPRDKQSLYFSATVSKKISQLIGEFSPTAEQVSVKSGDTAALVDQDVVRYQYPDNKIKRLHDILISEEADKVLIFGRTKRGVRELMFELKDRGFRAESIHGNKSQSQRQRALRSFREDEVDILVATDVAARGLDIDDVSHVINYEVPDTFEDYIHRIGRTGRGGKRGVAYTFVK